MEIQIETRNCSFENYFQIEELFESYSKADEFIVGMTGEVPRHRANMETEIT